MAIDWNAIDAKWQKAWRDDGIFDTDPDDRPKKFITVAYPYPNSPQHVGHGRTYTLADVHARFWRMRGYNVLLPMGFHYTGTPILGMARRVEEGDAELIDALRNIFGVADEDIKTFVEPINIADYFHKEIKTGMQEIGYSIDWRREFTTITPAYQKFIEWQVRTLHDKNLIVQGTHPVGWCPKDENPVSQHDTMGDVEPEFTEYILVKFTHDDYIIPTATLRPETLFGVTNLWANPEIVYKKITIGSEKWIVSSECAEKLEFQNKKISYDGEISGKDLLGQTVTTPDGKKKVRILPAGFVESDTGTGIVMSVPAHAPYDYQALHDLQKAGDGAAKGIQMISIIKTDGYGDCPAGQVIDELGITDQSDPRLEEATKEVYRREFHGGVLQQNCGQFAEKRVEDVKDEISEWLSEKRYSDILLELTNAPVRCRCGSECVVKLLDNQWFLDYGNQDWKKKTEQCLESMSILPNEIRPEFGYVIGWLRGRACARQHGLGTKLPWDRDWIVESLTDSTIYPAYYIISKFVNDGTIRAEDLTGGFFNYVFLGEGDADGVSRDTSIDPGVIKGIRDEFTYFYPVDSRHSGRDLVPNHLTFYVMNHVAIFPSAMWPRQIAVNGSILMGGKKMSKSMGNIIPLRQAMQKHGADPIRMAIIMSAELLQDADFGIESIPGIRHRLEALYESCSGHVGGAPPRTAVEDRWIMTRLGRLIHDVTVSMENMRMREALQEILFAFDGDLQWYVKRASAKNRDDYRPVLDEINRVRILLLSPFAPHMAEEMWEMLGHDRYVSQADWPEPGDSTDSLALYSESLLKAVMDDIANILKVTKISPKKITIYTADTFKRTVHRAVLTGIAGGKTEMGSMMKDLIADPETADVKKNPAFVQSVIKDVLSESAETRQMLLDSQDADEKRLLADELGSIVKSEFGADLAVFSENDDNIYDPKGKAKHARPFKPAILVE